MKKWLLLTMGALVALFGVNWLTEFNTESRVDELTKGIQRIAATGRSRSEVEQGLEGQGLEHVFGPSDNAIYGRKTVGRYRLIYSTELIYKIELDERGLVKSLQTDVFNEGL